MKHLLYTIGGYDPKIVKAGRLVAKFLLPSLSLMIVLIPSFYGGWHLADTITSGLWRLLFTLDFVLLILLVDYLKSNKNMQKSILKIPELIFAVFFIVSCTNFGRKSSCISSFERFVESVENKQSAYTDEDWECADLKFEQFADADYQKYVCKLTKEEKQKISKLKGKYIAICAKSEVGNVFDGIQDALDQLGGVVEGFAEDFDTENSDNQ
jgi:hypothetical protein